MTDYRGQVMEAAVVLTPTTKKKVATIQLTAFNSTPKRIKRLVAALATAAGKALEIEP